MPYSFILQTAFFVALGAIVIIIARALPRIEDETAVRRSFKGRIETLVSRIPFEKMDESLNLVFHKILRRLKVIILKADNIVAGKLRGLKGTEKRNSGIPLGSEEKEN